MIKYKIDIRKNKYVTKTNKAVRITRRQCKGDGRQDF